MKEMPILFSSAMVRAILSGTKTQTRRILTPQPEHLQYHEWRGKLAYEGEHRMWCWRGHMFENIWDEHIRDADRAALAKLCPYGAAGDRLWCKETWQAVHQARDMETGYVDDIRAAPSIPTSSDDGWWTPVYAADPTWDGESSDERGFPWRPSIFMPRWASRITLEIGEVRVQRLQEISEDDARAEGVHRNDAAVVYQHGRSGFDKDLSWTARGAFAVLWDSINGKPRPVLDDDGNPVLDDNDRPIMVASRSWASNPWVWALTFRRVP